MLPLAMLLSTGWPIVQFTQLFFAATAHTPHTKPYYFYPLLATNLLTFSTHKIRINFVRIKVIKTVETLSVVNSSLQALAWCLNMFIDRHQQQHIILILTRCQYKFFAMFLNMPWWQCLGLLDLKMITHWLWFWTRVKYYDMWLLPLLCRTFL